MGRVFREAEQYLTQLGVGSWIEIGTTRNGDDGSTRVIADWAKKQGRQLTTVDVDPAHCKLVKSFDIDNLSVVNSTGEDYLQGCRNRAEIISLLYLDNFDWDWHPDKTEDFVLEQQKRYQTLGLTMTNLNSQATHLAQMITALPVMAHTSIVVCDDTWYEPSWAQFFGKSAAVVPLLLNAGYRIMSTRSHPEYGTILTRGII